jgi:hypothetical protein
MQPTRTHRARTAHRLLIAIASLWLPCACASGDAPAGAAPPTEGFRALPAGGEPSMEKMRALIGDAACDNDSQCRTIAVGAKACGGPEAYLAWSTKRTDAAALRDATLGDGNLPPPARLRPGMVSNCSIVTDPGAYCAPSGSSPGTAAAPNQARACRLRSPGQGGRGPVN